jgi:RNA polymerase sigma factor (sigma-70 family)
MYGNAAPSLLQHVRRLAASASSDELLLANFLDRRSDDAFSALICRHGPMVLNVCRRILHDAHAAEDVFQATFLVLADRAAAIHRPASLAGFLHGVAYRLAVRARRRSMQSLPHSVCDKAAGPPEVLAWTEMLGILDHELGRLSDRYRAPLVLCYLEGRTQDEAARQLGWSLNTLRRRLTQGRRLLEARLRGRGVTLSGALAAVLAAGAVAVPGTLRAATLAAIGARALGGLTAGGSVLSSARKGLSLLLSTSGKKVGALIAVAALGAAVCFGYGWIPYSDQAPTASESTLTAQATGADQGDPMADPLPAQGAVRLGTARYRHGSRIESMAVSADGRLAAVASGWRSFSPAQVFDLTDGRCLYSLPQEYQRGIEAVGLSPDGKTLATRNDQFLCFRDAATGKELRKGKYLTDFGGGRSVTDWLTFTPDGKQIAVTLMGTAIHLFDVKTGEVRRKFEMGTAALACVFSPDGKLMATGGYEQEKGIYYARLWEVATGKELRRFAVGHELNRPIGALAFSHDGTKLAGGSWRDGQVRLFEVATGKELMVFPKIGEDIQGIAFAPDGKTLAAAGDSIHLYDSVTGKERLRIERRARGLAFNQDGSVLTGAVSGAIYRWDAASGRQLTPAAAQDSAVTQILVSADGQSVFTTDQDGDLRIWDAAGGKCPRRIAGGIERGFVASPDGRFLAWAVQDDQGNGRIRLDDQGNGRIRLYEVAAQQFIDRFPVIPGTTSVVAFLPDGKMLLTLGGRPATFRFWDVETGKLDAQLPGAAMVEDRVVPVRLWDVTTGKAGHELNEPMHVPNVPNEAGSGTTEMGGLRDDPPFYTTRRTALSSDGKTLAIGLDWGASFGNRAIRSMKAADGRAFSPDGRLLVDWAENPFGRSRMDHVYVWDTATGRAVASLTAGPRPGAANAAFAPDGRTLAVASADGIVRLWEAATWTVRAEFRGHRDRVTAVAFGPSGRLFTGGLDTVVLRWDVQPPRGPAKGTLADAWEALAHADGKTGFQAQGRFLAEPGKAAPWFAARLTPAVQPDLAQVKALIADLDDETFATRERATAQVKELWPATAAALREVVAKSATLEARRRAEVIIRDMEKAITPPGAIRALRAAEVLEWIATPEARSLLLHLAKGAPDAQLTREAAAACKRLGDGR